MPIYEVFKEDTGITLELEGDRPPKKEDLERAFAFHGQQKYPNAPVLQEPTSLYEKAKSVAPSLARLASPLGYGRPTSQDVATAGRVLQQVSEAPGMLIDKALGRDTYRKPEEMLDAASRIEREGIMALGSASTEKRERAARIGRSLGETISEYTPIPEYVTRPAGEVLGQVSADLLSPMNVMGLGIAGAARQAVRIPPLIAGAEFAESTTPAAVRAAQIADLRRASGGGSFPEALQKELVESTREYGFGGRGLKDSANAVDQVAKAIPRLLVPEITRGSAESAGIALQTISDPNATAEEKLKASYEALIGTLFAAGLGAEVARSLNVPGKKVTQVDILNDLASKKKTVGEAIGEVSGLLDQMERIVPVENLKTQFRKYINELNPDEPFVYSKEPVGGGVREQTKFPTEQELSALQKEQTAIERQNRVSEAGKQAALEKSAELSGTPLKTAEELFQDRNRPPVLPEKLSTARDVIVEEARRNAEIKAREEIAAEVGRPTAVEEGAVSSRKSTPFRTVDDVRAERLRTRDELEAESARPETLTTAEGVQAQRAGERQALRERAAAIRKVLGRREFTAEELMRGEPTPEVPAEPVRSGEIITPEFTVERPAPREGGKLSAREAIEAEGTPLRSVDDILAERLRVRDEGIAAQRQPAAQTSTPLETVEQKLSRALNEKDTRLAAEAMSEALESGAARGEPVKVTRSSIEKSLGIGKKRAGQSAAREIIFNEVWDKALQETQGKFRQKAEGIAQKLEGLRTEVDVGLGANPFPQLMGAAWNGALMVAQAVIRAGGSVADGVAAGIRYARQNFKGKFDDAEFGSQLARLIERPSPVQVPPGMQPRRFAERVAAAPGVPPQIREAVAESPRASYKKQSFDEIKQQASISSTADLLLDVADSKSNTKTVSGLELALRLIDEGLDQKAIKQFLDLAEEGTRAGQIIAQYKLFKSATKEGIILLVGKDLAKQGKTLLPEQATKLGDAMDAYKAASDKAKKASLTLTEAANTGDKNAQITAARDLDLANALKESADVELVKQISRINPSALADLYLSLVQGSVQGTVSLIGNASGAALSLLLGEPAKMLAYGIDQNLFGGKLGNTYGLRARTTTRLNSLRKSLPEGLKILWKGSEYNPYEIGTNIGTPLNFQRAARNLYDGLFNGAKDVPKLRNLFEATLGIYPDVIFRINQAVDNVFRSGERAALIEEIGKRRGLTDDQLNVAQRDPNLYLITDKAFEKGAKGFTADDIGYIEFESARSVLQQSNDITDFASGLNRTIRTKRPNFYIPWRIFTLFQKTPINFAAEAISYTPVGAFNILGDWKNLTPKERNLAASKLLIGSMVIAGWNKLYDKGIITPNLDTPGETNKARELAQSGGVMPPGTINTSGLYRYLKGEDPRFQPGDSVKDLAKFGTAGGLGMMVGTARRLQEKSRDNKMDWLAVGGNVVFSAANFVVRQGFLDGVSGFIKALSNEGGSALESLTKKFLSTATSPLHPGIMANFMRAQREFVPVTTGDSVIRSFANEMDQKYSSLPFVDGKKLPLKRDIWGEAVEQTPKGSNPWTYQFLNSWRSRAIDADPLNASIYQVWRKTADNRAIPSMPNPQITDGKVTFEELTPEQYDRYAQLVGFWRRKNAEVALGSRGYIQGSDDLKIHFLNQAYDRGIAIGKYRFLKELRKSGEILTPLAKRQGFQLESE